MTTLIVNGCAEEIAALEGRLREQATSAISASTASEGLSTGQLAALRDWAATGGHEISDDFVFRDEGYSGSRLDRPGLHALRDAVRDGVVGIVAVLTPDRLARKYAYQVLLLEEFRRAGVEIAFLQHPIS